MKPGAAPLQWRTDLVTAQVLVGALKEANPDLLVLDVDDSRGSRGTLTTVASLGVGAYGYVEKCRLQLAGDNFEQMVAVKRFHHTHRPNIQQLNHFLREASVLGILQHRNIVRLVGIGTEDGTIQGLYTAQELVEGQNLTELVESQVVNHGRPLYTTADAIRWCLQLAEAMRYIHIEHDLVHRDIKLSNLVLTSSNTAEADVKLLDWGLASKALQPDPSPSRAPGDTTWGHSLRGRPLKSPAPRASSTNRVGQPATDTRSCPRSCLSTGNLQQPEASTSGRKSGAADIASPLGRTARDSTPGNSSRGASRLAPGTLGGCPVLRQVPRGPPRVDVQLRSCSGGLPAMGLLGDPGDLMGTGSTGTPIYTAPETRLSKVFDQKVDVYCFGMMAYELFNCTTVLREAAMAGHTSATGAAAMMAGGWEPSFRRWCPGEVRDLVTKCWDPDPGGRPSADEIVVALTQMQERLSSAKPPEPGDSRQPQSGSKSESNSWSKSRSKSGSSSGSKSVSNLGSKSGSRRPSGAATPAAAAAAPATSQPKSDGFLRLFSCFSRNTRAL